MNRFEMAEQITNHVPTLAKRDKDEWQRAEALRAGFVADYSLTKIGNLTLDDYVIGKGANNRSFCYRLEREMDSLGRILGATAFKFGVYFGRTKSDATDQYRFHERWGATLDETFHAVKAAIVELLEAAARDDSTAITENPLSPMLKGKLLFVYYPEQYAPIYSEDHLEHFLAALNLSGSFECGADMQRALMGYRATWPELVAQPVPLYMRLLYFVFGYPPDDDAGGDDAKGVPLLDAAVRGAEFIQQMPANSGEELGDGERRGKIDFEAQQKRLKRTGDRGEAIVLELEKRRLLGAGRHELAERIKHVSQATDSAGYDILSFDEDGTDRPIEVKATAAADLSRGFYISSNEVEQASSLANYHLYIVFSTLSKKPRILPVRQPDLQGGAFTLRPVVFHATLPTHSVES